MSDVNVPKHILKYVRNRKNAPVGVVVAVADGDGGYNLGWSKCHKNDVFDREFGKSIAISRALADSDVERPHAVKPYWKEMKKRADSYFQIKKTKKSKKKSKK